MERLTRKMNGNAIHSHEPTENGSDLDRIDLLGEYEDTGLTPRNIILREGDIKLVQRINKQQMEKIFKLKEERDYWEREAKKHCAKLGEVKILIESESNVNVGGA